MFPGFVRPLVCPWSCVGADSLSNSLEWGSSWEGALPGLAVANIAKSSQRPRAGDQKAWPQSLSMLWRSTVPLAYDAAVANLSDQELEQTAAEAGITVGELKAALAGRDAGELPSKNDQFTKGKTHCRVQSRFPMPPAQALSQVQRVFGQQVDHLPARGADGQVRYVNEKLGVVYRVASASDGTPGGALVSVDVDVSRRVKEYNRRTLPLLAIIGVAVLLIGGLPLSSYIVLGGMCLMIGYQHKKRAVKFTENQARAVLERASQTALSG